MAERFAAPLWLASRVTPHPRRQGAWFFLLPQKPNVCWRFEGRHPSLAWAHRFPGRPADPL